MVVGLTTVRAFLTQAPPQAAPSSQTLVVH